MRLGKKRRQQPPSPPLETKHINLPRDQIADLIAGKTVIIQLGQPTQDLTIRMMVLNTEVTHRI